MATGPLNRASPCSPIEPPSAFDQVLGFLQAEVRTNRADFLDHVDLLVAAGGQHDGELGLLFGGFGRSRATTGARSGGHGHRSGGGDAPLLFQHLGELGGFQDGQGGEVVHQFFKLRHVLVSLRGDGM